MDTAATERERALEQRVKELERENALLKSAPAPPAAPKRKKCILDDSDSDSDEAAVPVTQSPRPRKRPRATRSPARAVRVPCGDWQRLRPPSRTASSSAC